MTSSLPLQSLRQRKILIGISALLGTLGLLAGAASMDDEDQYQLPTTPDAFYEHGTQPETDAELFRPIDSATNCVYCHGEFDVDSAPYDSWITSMMGQSARDPIWKAALAIANQDAVGGGETCIRCHAPGAWLAGKSSDGFIDDFDALDHEGINCNFCHRAVNPDPKGDAAIGYPDSGPLDPDPPILKALEDAGHKTEHVGNATFVIDPADVRRGPYGDIIPDFWGVHGTDGFGSYVWLIESPYHRESALCGECHDVSNPLYLYNKVTNSYELTDLDQSHPTHDPMDMFPEQRTYSEWLISDFADGGVAFDDSRFGGNHPTGLMQSCQDCHMPKQVGAGCVFVAGIHDRDDIGQHSFAGANTWVLEAIKHQLGDEASTIGLTEDRVQAAKARTIRMLKDASDMELSLPSATSLNVRIINQSGHKLPTGYPEGRRMWLNVRFYDEDKSLIAESGEYNYVDAILDTEGTKIYEMISGISEEVADVVNLEPGPSFHLTLNNVVLSDNRIPPRGATNAELNAVYAAPVDYYYADNQYWDDTLYDIPEETKTIVATLYHQTTTKEYIDFLRLNALDGTGSIAANLWQLHGQSAPVAMDVQTIEVVPQLDGDLNGDGQVNGIDITIILAAWGTNDPNADLTGDGVVNGGDLTIVLANWSF